MTKITIVCNRCGSEDVMRDAWSFWSVEEQEWGVYAVYDHAYCNNCEGETSLIEKELSDV